MRASVSSRMRAISAFDHSRTAATSSSARRRRPAASSADPVRISSTAALASASKRVIVSSREVSAAACIARLRSAMNLVGRREPAVAVASVMSVVTSSSAAVGSSTTSASSVGCPVGFGRPRSTASAAHSVGRRHRRRVGRLLGVAPLGRQGSRKPGRVSVWAIGLDPRSWGRRAGSIRRPRLSASWQRGSVRCSWLVVPAVRAGGTAGVPWRTAAVPRLRRGRPRSGLPWAG